MDTFVCLRMLSLQSHDVPVCALSNPNWRFTPLATLVRDGEHEVKVKVKVKEQPRQRATLGGQLLSLLPTSDLLHIPATLLQCLRLTVTQPPLAIRFSALPTELDNRILSSCGHDTLHDISSVSEYYRKLSGPLLYRDLGFDRRFEIHVRLLLLALIQRPDCAEHVKSVSFSAEWKEAVVIHQKFLRYYPYQRP